MRPQEDSETELALSVNEAIRIMNDMELITTDIFDYFFLLVLQWYQEEMNEDDVVEVPNLYYVVVGEHKYSSMFVNAFIQGFARQYCDHHNIEPKPASFEFSPQDEELYRRMFMQHYSELQPDMRHDIELVLDGMHLSYVWDTRDVGGNECVLKNSSITGVW